MKKALAAVLCLAVLAGAPALPVQAQYDSGTNDSSGVGLSTQSNPDDADPAFGPRTGGWGYNNYPRRWDRYDRFGSYNGYRGYPDRRPGYRYHDGFWYPNAAFGVQIYIDRDRPNRVRLSERHIDWCEENYRSYRISDNTFKPRRGPRRECISPYY